MSPVVFHNFPKHAFPFTVEMYDVDTGEVYSTERIEGPGALTVRVKPTHVREAACRMIFADGRIVDSADE